MKLHNRFLLRLIMTIGVILIGIVSLFYLHNMFKPKEGVAFVKPTWMVYRQDWHEDSDPLIISIEVPQEEVKVETVKEQKTVKKETTKTTAKKSKLYSDKDVDALCKLVYGEGRGLNKTEMSAIVWCVLNRVDSKIFPNTIYEVCTQKGQFSGYKSHHPIWDNIKELVLDVLGRWEKEKAGAKNVGRTLPKTYLFFVGDGKHNHYMEKWKSGVYYKWTLKSPYK